MDAILPPVEKTPASSMSDLHGSMKTYIINLDRAVDRWTRVERLMAPTGIEYERVSAVLGKALQLPIPEFSERLYRLCHGKRPNLGTVGCFLSHIKTLRLFLQTNAEHAIICEDDITPAINLRSVVEAAIQYQDAWDILRLSGFHHSHPRRVCQLDDQHHLAVNFTRLCGTGSYAVSRHAAEVLLEKLLPMKVPIDHALDREWFYGLRAMSVDPLPVLQNPVDLPTSLPQADNEKLPAWQRYWTVFPYRAFNEACRLVARTRMLQSSRLLCRTLQLDSVKLKAPDGRARAA